MALTDGRMTTKEAADYLGVNEQSIRLRARKKQIGFLKIGVAYWFTKEDLSPLVQSNSPHNATNANTDIN